jgi:hypothetical protein
VPQPAETGSMNDLKNKNKFFILRNGSESFAMTNISISTDQKTLECNLAVLPYEHRVYVNNSNRNKMKYAKSGNALEDGSMVLNEVHIYVSPDKNIATGPYTLALDKINKTEIIEPDVQKTRRSKTTGIIVGVSSAVVVVGGLLLAIAAASLSSWHY